MSKRQIHGMRALVTGASSGIGRCLAAKLARHGIDLILTARNEERLLETAAEARVHGTNVLCLAGDITSSNHRADLIDVTKNSLGGLDILVNNAGLGFIQPFLNSREASIRQVMEVNFFAGAELIRAALPILQHGTRPIIVHVGSVLGRRGVPFYSVYCASKFAMQGFCESLRAELAGCGIDILLVNPGTVDTGFLSRAEEQMVAVPWRTSRGVTPDFVAEQIVDGIIKRRTEVVPDARGKLLVWANRLFPRLADAWLARYGKSLCEGKAF